VAVVKSTGSITTRTATRPWATTFTCSGSTRLASRHGRTAASRFADLWVSSVLSSKSRLDLRLSSEGLALAAWSDGRNDGGDIYAQDIKPDCSLGQ